MYVKIRTNSLCHLIWSRVTRKGQNLKKMTPINKQRDIKVCDQDYDNALKKKQQKKNGKERSNESLLLLEASSSNGQFLW